MESKLMSFEILVLGLLLGSAALLILIPFLCWRAERKRKAKALAKRNQPTMGARSSGYAGSGSRSGARSSTDTGYSYAHHDQGSWGGSGGSGCHGGDSGGSDGGGGGCDGGGGGGD